MKYLVCVNVDKNYIIKYLVPVEANTDFDAGLKAHEILKTLSNEGYKYVEIKITEDTKRE